MDARRHVWYYDGRKLNGGAMYHAGEPIPYKETQRGDYIRFDTKAEWTPDHIAIVTRWRNGETIEIMDNYEKPWYVTTREIKVYGWIYGGKWKVNAMRLDYGYTVAIDRTTGKPFRYKK